MVIMRDYPPGHQSPKQHGDEEADGVADHDDGAGGASQIRVGDLRDKDRSRDHVAAGAVPSDKPMYAQIRDFNIL